MESLVILKCLYERAHKMFTKDYLLHVKLNRLTETFMKIKNFLPNVHRIFRHVEQENRDTPTLNTDKEIEQKNNQPKIV